ncbi:MAG: tRNA (cytidine(34)-2'-O)-methyltransferase [Alphaproteobacteria bacterium]|nr:tRNA (cytidine(34)-2'-O)-methyltransferase [Alphaproteobacteria bacterium]
MVCPFSVSLIEPDIPQNTGAIMRLCACLSVPLHLIEPFGFVWDERLMKRGGLDYLDKVVINRHIDFHHFLLSLSAVPITATTPPAATHHPPTVSTTTAAITTGTITANMSSPRTILFTTRATTSIHAFSFQRGDCFIYGSESRGAPQTVHDLVDHRLTIPIADNTRSLNLATAVAFSLGVALQQTLS